MTDKKYLDYEGLQVLVAQIKAHFARTGALIFQDTVATVSALPTLTADKIGYVYMFTADAITSADFVEGAGKPINQYDEVVCVNTGSEASPILKWQILGPVFDISGCLQFGNAFPANPTDEQTFLYMGSTTYTYHSVTPEGTENPSELGWYVSDGAGGYVLTTDTTVQSGTAYYERSEEYVHGVIYVYSTSEAAWVAQSSGDTMVAIAGAEIEAMFE